jgi:ParB/RepB/Spo0J family partition protein
MMVTMPASNASRFKFPPEVAAAAKMEKKTGVMLPIDAIDRGDNPREDFGNEEEEKALADSLTNLSVLAPILVAPINEPGEQRYELIAGERRLRAAKLAGHKKISATIITAPRPVLIEVMVAENLQRKQLNLIEQARAFAMLCRPIHEGGAGLKHDEAAKKSGCATSHLNRVLAVLNLPDAWQKRIASGELGCSKATWIAGYANRPDVLAAVELAMAANPERWEQSWDFRRELQEVAARFDALPRPGAGVPAVGESSRPKLIFAGKNQAARVHYRGKRYSLGVGDTPEVRKRYEALLAKFDREEKSLAPFQLRRSSPVQHDLQDPATKNGDDGHLVAPPPAAALIGESDAPSDPVATAIAAIKLLTTQAEIERVERELRKQEARIGSD